MSGVIPALQLNDGRTIPQLGLGVYQVDPERTAAVVLTALELGYRHIDTAQMYGNEAGVGDAVRRSGLPREEIFLTTKLNNGNHDPDRARESFAAGLRALGTDHVDLFLIHWPLPTVGDGDFVRTWKVLEEFHAEGRARSIGVSNFQVAHLERLLAGSQTVPAVNQVEVHPWFGNEEVRRFGQEHGIVTEAWSPIAQGAVLDDPVVVALAEQTGRTPAQVVLRWHLQRGDVVFPKSSNRERMAQNLALFDFELAPEQLAALSALDRGEQGRRGPNPDHFDWIPD